jgi:electron transfer flavoprotein beta subunit
MKAKKKPFKKISLKDLDLEEGAKPRLEVLNVREPPKREGGAKVASVDELISKLKEAGRI